MTTDGPSPEGDSSAGGHRQVAVAGLLMASVLALCRFASLGKELYVASVFGAGTVMDAYSLLILVPSLGVAFFVNAVRRAFLALYPRYKSGSDDNSQQFANLYLGHLLLAGMGMSVVLLFGLKPIWRLVLSAENPTLIATVEDLTSLAALLIVPMAAVSGLTAVMNARHYFSSPQWTHVIPTATIVTFLVVAGREWGARALIAGLLTGTILQAVVLLVMTVRCGHRPAVRIVSREAASLWVLSLPIVLIDSIGQGNVFVDRAMASTLEPGRIAVLYWASLVKDFISGTLIASLLWVLLPHFSEQAARGAKDELRESSSLVIRYSALLMFPITTILIVCAPSFLAAMQIGALNSDAARSLGWCLAAYSLGLFAELAGPALAQVLLVLGHIRGLLFVGVFGAFLPNVLLNFVLIGPLGEAGLALSTAVVAWVVFGAHLLLTRRALVGHSNSRTIRTALFALIASVGAAAASYGVFLLAGPFLSGVAGAGLWLPVLASLIGFALYSFLMLVYPGNDEARHVWTLVKNKWQKRSP